MATHQASVRAHHQTLIHGLVALQPKKRSSKVSWVIFAGLAYFVGALMMDGSVREAFFSPRVAARPQQVVATMPAAQVRRAPVQVQQAPVQVAARPAVQVAAVAAPQQPAAVAVPAFVLPAAAAPQPMAAPSDPNITLDAPLPGAKAHNAAPTKRAHSAKRK